MKEEIESRVAVWWARSIACPESVAKSSGHRFLCEEGTAFSKQRPGAATGSGSRAGLSLVVLFLKLPVPSASPGLPSTREAQSPAKQRGQGTCWGMVSF